MFNWIKLIDRAIVRMAVDVPDFEGNHLAGVQSGPVGNGERGLVLQVARGND